MRKIKQWVLPIMCIMLTKKQVPCLSNLGYINQTAGRKQQEVGTWSTLCQGYGRQACCSWTTNKYDIVQNSTIICKVRTYTLYTNTSLLNTQLFIYCRKNYPSGASMYTTKQLTLHWKSIKSHFKCVEANQQLQTYYCTIQLVTVQLWTLYCAWRFSSAKK